MKASRTLPLSIYSRRMVMSAESCHILQYGHWKSLAMIIQTFAAGLPRIRALSARTTIGSVDAFWLATDAPDAGGVADAAAGVADFSSAGLVVARAFSAPLHAATTLTSAIAMKRMKWLMAQRYRPARRAGYRLACASHHVIRMGHTSCTPARWNSRATLATRRPRRRDDWSSHRSRAMVVSRSVQCALRELRRSRLTSSEGSCANSREA